MSVTVNTNSTTFPVTVTADGTTVDVTVSTSAPAISVTVDTSGGLLPANNLSDVENEATARTNLDVYSKAEIGDVTTNFLTLYNS